MAGPLAGRRGKHGRNVRATNTDSHAAEQGASMRIAAVLRRRSAVVPLLVVCVPGRHAPLRVVAARSGPGVPTSNLISGFATTGIWPLNPHAMDGRFNFATQYATDLQKKVATILSQMGTAPAAGGAGTSVADATDDDDGDHDGDHGGDHDDNDGDDDDGEDGLTEEDRIAVEMIKLLESKEDVLATMEEALKKVNGGKMPTPARLLTATEFLLQRAAAVTAKHDAKEKAVADKAAKAMKRVEKKAALEVDKAQKAAARQSKLDARWRRRLWPRPPSGARRSGRQSRRRRPPRCANQRLRPRLQHKTTQHLLRPRRPAVVPSAVCREPLGTAPSAQSTLTGTPTTTMTTADTSGTTNQHPYVQASCIGRACPQFR